MSSSDGAGSGSGSGASTGQRIAFIAGPLVALLGLVLARAGATPPGFTPDALIVAGVAFWMATWWISEAAPIAATSLLPLACFPMTGTLPIADVARPYMHPFILLLMAGFMAALAIERHHLHRRLSLHVLLRVGTSPRRLILGMMLASAICSMWISNTATTLMMLPIGLSLVSRASEGAPADDPRVRAFATALFLGIAYASSVGGLGTPIGTPPNLIFMGVYQQTFPDRPPITFLSWMAFALPLVAAAVAGIWLYLTRIAHPVGATLEVGGRELLSRELRDMGRLTPDQRRVALIFGLMALGWVTRKISLGAGGAVGWAPLLGIEDTADDATVAILGVLLLFCWPSRSHPGEPLLDWPTARRIPWEVVLLFGGGVSLADAFKSSGLSQAIATGLAGLEALPVLALALIIALVVTFLTELTSNTATATILMPVLAAFSVATGLDPELVMIPGVLAASCAFMLPVATAPNAIVYGSGQVTMGQMARAGFALNLVGAGLIALWATLYFG